MMMHIGKTDTKHNTWLDKLPADRQEYYKSAFVRGILLYRMLTKRLGHDVVEKIRDFFVWKVTGSMAPLGNINCYVEHSRVTPSIRYCTCKRMYCRRAQPQSRFKVRHSFHQVFAWMLKRRQN